MRNLGYSSMTSESRCVCSCKAREVCGETAVDSKIDSVECESSFSCLNESHGKLAFGRADCISCSALEEKASGARNDGLCSAKRIQPDNLPENGADACLPNLITTVSADENSCLNGEDGGREAAASIQLKQYKRSRNGNTLQDLYMQEVYDDEDDDSDWEPANSFVIKKWFCANCTLPNFDDVSNCDVCGEHKESEILKLIATAQIGRDSRSSVSLDAVNRDRDAGSSSKTCTAIGFDERMLLHCEVEMKSHPHPERPDRLRVIAACLAAAGIFPGKCSLIPSREITMDELLMVHTSDHIEAVQETSGMISSYFTSDTYANEHSARAARLAAGLCADLACSIMLGHSKNGFALVRPPGHHAGIKQAMGFCLHNNAAVAALAAQRVGAKKVLIVDWDVHHGNGTQEIFESNKSVLYVSLHRHEGGRFYPGTGGADEVGILDGKGYSVNIPWNRGGVGDNDYIFAFQHIVLPIANEFAPDITIISAGFDAARGDPLGCCDVTPAGFAQMAYMLTALSQGKLLVILEGGYNLRSISSSATEVVKVLVGENPNNEMRDVTPSKAGLQTVLQVARIQLEFWPIIKQSCSILKSKWEALSTLSRGSQVKKRKRLIGPLWWKWGSKRFIYKLLYNGLRLKRQRLRERQC